MLCGSPGANELDLCDDCFNELPRNLSCCYHCGENFAQIYDSPQLCGRCLQHTPGFDDTQAPFLYQGSMRYLITRLKFERQYKNARLLGTLLARHLATSAELPECIVPIPLHRNRYRQRGFNQSIEIARHLSTRLQIPLDIDTCIRLRDTNQQTSLSAELRRKNMRQAFGITKPPGYKHVALVDDVLTTGATASALALNLKQHGVERVDVWVCARA
jgi:ComF family protein